MADPVKQRFYNILSTTYGTSDTYNTVKEASVDESASFVTDSGDNDTTETVLGKGVSQVSCSLTISDPIQAQAIKNHAKADLKIVGVAGGTGGTNVLLTMVGAVFSGRSQRAMHNGVWGTTLSGRCDSFTVAPVTP